MGKEQISAVVEKAVVDHIFPGAVLMCARKGTIVFHQAFGLANLFDKKIMKPDSIFDLASLTKPLATGLSICHLIEKEKLTLQTPLKLILKDVDLTDKADLTIDMLLRHTSGLPAYKEYYKELVKTDHDRKNALRQMLISEPLIHLPGQCQEYSDLGFMLLGWVIESLTQVTLDQYVGQKIYQPLGIKTLFYISDKNKENIMDRYGSLLVATQQCPWRKRLMIGEVDDDNTWAVGGVDGHAGLFGDASAILILCLEILNALNHRQTKLLSSDVLRQMTCRKDQHDMVAGFDTPSKINSSAGKYFSHRSVGHLGFTGTSFWIDPEADLIVIFLTNRVHPTRDNVRLKQFRPQLHNLIYEQLV